MSNNPSGCCSGGGSCCPPQPGKKQIVIDFFYLDLSVCERCQGADYNLTQAIDEVSGVLEAAGFAIIVNKINITSKELAMKHQFLSSPTIRLNGADLDWEVKESFCQECGDLCGDATDCRVWNYEGIEYTEPPKAMIINAILKAVYGERKIEACKAKGYELPNNLQRFFDGVERKVK